MKHRILLAVVIVLALAALSCSLGSLPSGEEPPPPTQAPAVSAGEMPAPPQPPAPPTESPRVRPVDGMVMVHIPAGDFLMGLDESAFAPQRPAHLVAELLAAYFHPSIVS